MHLCVCACMCACICPDWLIVSWCLSPLSTVFQLNSGGQFTYPCFPEVLLTSTPHIIPSKPLAAFPRNHCQNKGQQSERNESCPNDYHHSEDRILSELGSNQRPHVLKFCTLPTELSGLTYVCLDICPELSHP